ncbi:hypothetical protein Tco_0934311, partial [Tanacetum coccineum]
ARVIVEQEAVYARDAWGFAMDKIKALQHQRQESDDILTMFRERVRALERHSGQPNTGRSTLPAQDTNRISGNHSNGHSNSAGGGECTIRNCTYKDFLNCPPHNFSGTKGAVGLARWYEKMESVFHVSNYDDNYQVNFATCTLLDGALTWWNTHMKTTGIDCNTPK